MSAPNTPVCTGAPSTASASTKLTDQRFGDRPRRRGVPRRATALCGVAVERELTDHQDRRADVARGFLVVENPELPNLFGQPSRLVDGVVVGDTHECDKPLSLRANLADGLGSETAGDRHAS